MQAIQMKSARVSGVRAQTARVVRAMPVVRCQAAKQESHQAIKQAATLLAVNALMAAPAFATAGKIFDFNMTMPIMASEFLLLMVFLEKTWFTPVGKVLDERDALIREKLGSVKDNTGDVDKFIFEAEGILREARGAVADDISSKKVAKQAELDKLYNEAKANITRETESAISALEKESSAMLAKLDAQVDKISSEVLKRVLPEGVRI